jgi:lysophospholipase L1-like esterase
MGKLRSLGKSLLTLVVTLIVVYLIGEVLVFALYRDRIAIFPRYVTDVHYGDFHIRGNVPNSHYRHKSADGSWEFFINAQGFRDTSDFGYEKPAGVLRVLVLGDSFTIGYEVAQDETYSAVLERYLHKRGLDAQVINAGMSGNSTAEALVFLENEGLKYDPDVVVLGFYWNDLEDNIKANLFRLKDGELDLNQREYVPAIRIRNVLNSFGLYRWLSEHSYLHNYLNNVATIYFKRKLLRSRREELAQGGGMDDSGQDAYKTELGRALVGRMRESANASGAELILLDIASMELKRSFPWRGELDEGVVADVYVDTVPLLSEYAGLTPLRVVHGDGHWTPFSHLVAAVALGDAIIELGHGAAQGDRGD